MPAYCVPARPVPLILLGAGFLCAGMIPWLMVVPGLEDTDICRQPIYEGSLMCIVVLPIQVAILSWFLLSKEASRLARLLAVAIVPLGIAVAAVNLSYHDKEDVCRYDSDSTRPGRARNRDDVTDDQARLLGAQMGAAGVVLALGLWPVAIPLAWFMGATLAFMPLVVVYSVLSRQLHRWTALAADLLYARWLFKLSANTACCLPSPEDQHTDTANDRIDLREKYREKPSAMHLWAALSLVLLFHGPVIIAAIALLAQVQDKDQCANPLANTTVGGIVALCLFDVLIVPTLTIQRIRKYRILALASTLATFALFCFFSYALHIYNFEDVCRDVVWWEDNRPHTPDQNRIVTSSLLVGLFGFLTGAWFLSGPLIWGTLYWLVIVPIFGRALFGCDDCDECCTRACRGMFFCWTGDNDPPEHEYDDEDQPYLRRMREQKQEQKSTAVRVEPVPKPPAAPVPLDVLPKQLPPSAYVEPPPAPPLDPAKEAAPHSPPAFDEVEDGLLGAVGDILANDAFAPVPHTPPLEPSAPLPAGTAHPIVPGGLPSSVVAAADAPPPFDRPPSYAPPPFDDSKAPPFDRPPSYAPPPFDDSKAPPPSDPPPPYLDSVGPVASPGSPAPPYAPGGIAARAGARHDVFCGSCGAKRLRERDRFCRGCGDSYGPSPGAGASTQRDTHTHAGSRTRTKKKPKRRKPDWRDEI